MAICPRTPNTTRRANSRASSKAASAKSKPSCRPPRSSTPPSLNNTGKVIFGATVDLEDQDDGKRISYQIVGEDEADIKTGRISITSPIARAIVGKSVGDVVDVVAPGGKHSYEVMEVRYV